MKTYELKEILNDFLNRWTIETIQDLTLREYVGLGNKDTFCQWVETKTRVLGSIKGQSSIKFGIYERKEPNKKPKTFKNDSQYSWLKSYGNNKEEAFKSIKEEIIKIIDFSEKGNFSEIDKIRLPNLFKWKIAFLYSNERLIPIYKKDILLKIANHFGLKADRKTQISKIQEIMMLNKPLDLDVFSFMQKLFDQFGGKGNNKKEALITIQKTSLKRDKRKPTNERNITPQLRTASGTTYITEQKHNKIQQALVKKLSKEYGKENVIIEENYVDVKLVQPDFIHFYEVKSSSYPFDCIREALGQILLYSLKDEDKRPKKHIVVGQYEATEEDKKYIDFLKQNLKLHFDYLNVDIE